MASDAAFAPQERARTEQIVAETAFVAFLLLVFVGLQPFAPRFPELLKLGESGTSGAGDLLRQVSYLAVFSTIAFCTFRRYGMESLALVPVLLSFDLIWCLLSSSWAAEGSVTFRRAGLEVVIVLTAMWGVETVGIERSLKLFRAVLIGILIVNWVSVFLTMRAIHMPGEPDPSIVGAWRGLYYHKNIAGAVCAISTMVFMFFAIDQRSRTDWLLCFASLGFLAMTHSKSSGGLLVPALLGWGIYRATAGRGLERSIAFVASALVLLAVTTVAIADWDTIVQFVSDPQEFTGRTAVWAAELAFIADHPIFGSGYGSFADTGAISPLHNYVSGEWIETIAHGHNGYLQLVVEIGFVGFLLSIFALVAQPALAFWRRDAIPVPFKAFLFALFVFMVFHNLMESDFLQADGPTWVAFLFTIAWLRQARAVAVAPESRR